MENNWCIRLTDENRNVVLMYLNAKYNRAVYGDSKYYGVYKGNFNCDDAPWFTELTFEEFKTKILGDGYKSEILSTSTNNPPINKFLSELDKDTNGVVTGTPKYYDNSKGSLYQFAEHHKLNAWEFDIVKRVVRCREKGNFTEDLEKTKKVIDLYLKEFKP